MKLPTHTRKTQGFTLVELLVVSLLIASLASIAVVVVVRTINTAKETQDKQMTREFQLATKDFFEDNSIWPMPESVAVSDALEEDSGWPTDTVDGTSIFQDLAGRIGDSNWNQRQKPYFTIESKLASGDKNGFILDNNGNITSLVDSFGNPYQLFFDYDNDGIVTLANVNGCDWQIYVQQAGEEQIRNTGAVMASGGRDNQLNQQKDVLSWQ